MNTWMKATASGAENCVEVQRSTDTVRVRDSKDRNSPELVFTPAEWAAFLDGAKAGEFG